MRGVARAGFLIVAPTLKAAATHARSRHLFVVDVLGMIVASLLALWLSVGDAALPIPTWVFTDFWWLVVLVVAVRNVVSIATGLYQHSWRFASVPDMGRIVVTVLSGSAVAIAIVLVARFLPVVAGQPEYLDGAGVTYWVLELFLALAVIALPRFAIRALSEVAGRQPRGPSSEADRTLLYGAGWAGVMVARSAHRGIDSPVVPVGFLDDDPDIKGRRVAGLPVFGGIEAMARARKRSKATSLLVTMPSASGEAVRRVVDAAMDLGLDVRTVPPMTDLLDGSLDATRIRSVRVEDLLRRPMASDHAPEVKAIFEGRTVLITGAGGSIGSELARQVLAVHPKRLVLVDRAESALYMVQREVEERRSEGMSNGAHWEDVEIVTRLANVVSRPMMQRLFEAERPDIVFHAAAYKHVPMLEDHPSEAVQVNVAGTMSVMDAAAETGVGRLVLVSTDKAVTPSSVMGATKRLAEMLVADTARQRGLPFVAVRFGNVLGSNGSVVPIFQAQLERGQPLTITHPEMTRYFMTIPEAAWLLLDAASLANDHAGLFVLDMGTPVRVLDVARDLVRLSGRDPDSVPIRVVGLRKGEKLHEALFYDEEKAQPTAVPKVLRVDSVEPPRDIRQTALDLIRLANGLDEATLGQKLRAAIAVLDEAPAVGSSDAPPAPRREERVAIPIGAGATSAARGRGVISG
jgi:FlaA1/EpsC-like NDP-sugar epimerase